MSEIKLTKDADALICVLYKRYLQNQKARVSEDIARSFGGSDSIQSALMHKWNIADIDETCRELHNAGLLNCFFIDNTVGEAELTNKGIAYMKGRSGRKASTIFNILERLRALLPW